MICVKFNTDSKLAGYYPFDYSLSNLFSQSKIARDVLYLYDMYSQQVDINTWLLIAQMAHETDYLTSWWSQSPRYNFAGYGVTGRISNLYPLDTTTSKWVLKDNLWYEGFSFSSYDVAIKTHIGHLLAYMYTDVQLNAIQKQFVILSPRRVLLGNNRGSVKMVQDLNRKWAVGDKYGQGIVDVANYLGTKI